MNQLVWTVALAALVSVSMLAGATLYAFVSEIGESSEVFAGVEFGQQAPRHIKGTCDAADALYIRLRGVETCR